MKREAIGIDNRHLASIYMSSRYFGCDTIIREYLGLPQDLPLPITIPHGIDFHRDVVMGEIDSYEPIYLALREDIAEKASRRKAVLTFPHPWLMLLEGSDVPQGEGTLFIAPPPSEKDFEVMYQRVLEGEYPKPWGILLKDRGLVMSDFDWWASRGFATHTAGTPLNPLFFRQMRDIFCTYRHVASPYMSSAVIFAVAMSRIALAIPDVPIEYVEVGDLEQCLDFEDREGKIQQTWQALFSADGTVAREQAELLLGKRYMGPPGELRSRLLSALSALDAPLHLPPLRNGIVYRGILWLVCRGIPAHKIFPCPSKKISQKLLARVKLNRLTVYHGCDFAHYGVTGSLGRHKLRKLFAFQLGASAVPGYAFRKGSEAATAQNGSDLAKVPDPR